MRSVGDTFFCACVVAVFTGFIETQASAYTGDEVTSPEVSKRGWSMLRLGRGLQMLRLGKRNGLDNLRLGRQVQGYEEEIPWDRLSAEELSALLAAFTEPRDQGRRQPPLPRYGRQITNTARDLLDILSGENSDHDESAGETVLFRHPPRGGRRYKRSLDSPVASGMFYSPFYGQDYFMNRNYRAVALPRYGRYIQAIPKQQARAVPRPRIGRMSNEQPSSEKADS